MEINNCLNCIGSCCKLEVDITKKEYENISNLGLEKNILKRSDIFLKDYPNYSNRTKFLDKMYKNNFAKLKRSNDGFCELLNKDTRICSIYENRPNVCKEYSNNSTSCKKIRECIK